MVGDLARVVVAPEFRGEEGVDLTSGEGFQFHSVPVVSSARTFLRGGESDDHARGTFGARGDHGQVFDLVGLCDAGEFGEKFGAGPLVGVVEEQRGGGAGALIPGEHAHVGQECLAQELRDQGAVGTPHRRVVQFGVPCLVA